MFVLARPRTRWANKPESTVFDFVADTEQGGYITFDTLAEAKAYEAEHHPEGLHLIFELVG